MLSAALLLSQGWGRSPGPHTSLRGGQRGQAVMLVGRQEPALSQPLPDKQLGSLQGQQQTLIGPCVAPSRRRRHRKRLGVPGTPGGWAVRCWEWGCVADLSLPPHPIPSGPSHPTATSPLRRCSPIGCCQPPPETIQSLQENPGNIWAKLLNQLLHLLPSGSPWLSPPPHPSPSQILLGMKSAKKAGFPLIPSLAKALCNTICTPLCCLSFPLTISSAALGVGQQQGAVSTALRRLQVDVPKGHDEGGARGGPQLPMAHRVVGVRAGVVPGAQRPALCCQHCVAAAVPYMKAKEWGCSPCLSFPMLHCPVGIWVLFQSRLGMTPPPHGHGGLNFPPADVTVPPLCFQDPDVGEITPQGCTVPSPPLRPPPQRGISWRSAPKIQI